MTLVCERACLRACVRAWVGACLRVVPRATHTHIYTWVYVDGDVEQPRVAFWFCCLHVCTTHPPILTNTHSLTHSLTSIKFTFSLARSSSKAASLTPTLPVPQLQRATDHGRQRWPSDKPQQFQATQGSRCPNTDVNVVFINQPTTLSSSSR